MKIYDRTYDEPINKDGTKKPVVFLGNFKIIQTIFVDMYSSMRIGIKDNRVYLIKEREKSYDNGGTIFTIKELKNLTKRLNSNPSR
jgi:hypothetical protein